MDTSDLKNQLDADKVSAFLKTEAFYLAVVIFVAVTAMSSTFVRFTHEYADGPGRTIINQKELYLNFYNTLSGLIRDKRAAAIFPVAVIVFKAIMLLLGVITTIGVAATWVVKRGKPPAGGPAREPLSPPAWGLWDVLKLGAFFAAGGLVMHAIFGSFNEGPLATPRACLAEIFSQVLMVGVMLHIIRFERGGRVADLGVHARGVPAAVVLGLLGFLAVQPFIFCLEAIQSYLLPVVPMQDALQVMLSTRSPIVLLMSGIIAGLIVPVTEELLFRGFLQSALRRWVGRTMSVVVSAAFFAAAHIDLYSLLPLFVLGLALGYVYARSRSIVAPIVLHAAFNGTSLLAMYAMRYVSTMR